MDISCSYCIRNYEIFRHLKKKDYFQATYYMLIADNNAQMIVSLLMKTLFFHLHLIYLHLKKLARPLSNVSRGIPGREVRLCRVLKCVVYKLASRNFGTMKSACRYPHYFRRTNMEAGTFLSNSTGCIPQNIQRVSSYLTDMK